MLVEAITDYAIYMLDPNGIVISWNPGARRFKGYEEAEIIGQHFSRFYTDEDRRSGLPARALGIADREGRFIAEGWRVRKDGTRFWAYVIIDPIRDPAGRLVGFAKVTRDLTERREAEEALRRSEEQFRLLVQGVSDYAIYMLDLQGNVSSWNAGAERIKGYTADEILHRHFSIFYPEEDRAAGLPRRALETAAREGRFEQEGIRQRKDGSRFLAHAVIDAVRDSSGRLVGFAKITRDVTERVEAQRRLEEARESLFQAQKMEAVGQLSAGVAHDFNNLLAAILGGLELLRKRLPDDPRARQLLDGVKQAAERGASLTQRMLAFARRQHLAICAVDLAGLVSGMSDLAARSIGPAFDLTVDLPAGLPPVSTDPHHLESAILNLVVNARDAMPAGGTIAIGADAVDLPAGNLHGLSAGPYVRLTVTDQGVGMDEGTLMRAVEPFFTTKGVGKGTGLGLSMVHGLALQSGGTMTIESRPGAGTTVGLLLPVATGQRSMDAPATDAARPVDGAPLPPLRVLVVDDDPLVLESTSAMLEDAGHRTVRATSGETALDLLAADPAVDLVLTDHAMPHMTGLELVREIRRTRPDMPVLLASGFAGLPANDEVGAPRLSKPFTQDELVAAIAGVLAARTA